MGSFDELELNGIHWQTKALGKHLRTYRPGDEVDVERVATTAEEAAVAQTYTYDEVPQRYLVEIQAVEYALIEDGRLVGIADEATRTELADNTFDYYGRDRREQAAEIFGLEVDRPTSPGQPPVGPRPSAARASRPE